MRLLFINKSIRDKIRGTWKRYNKLEPIEVVKDTWYILGLDDILRIMPNLTKEKISHFMLLGVRWFTVGDGSALDIKYQEYLAAQQDEFLAIV